MHGLGRTGQGTQSTGILRQNPFCLLLCSLLFYWRLGSREKGEYILAMLEMVVKRHWKRFGLFSQLVILRTFNYTNFFLTSLAIS